MRNVQVGDYLFDEKGKPCCVLHCSSVEFRECYRVLFSDGSEITADASHLWATLDRAARSAIKRRCESLPEDWASWCSVGRPVAAQSFGRTHSFGGGRPHAVIAGGFCSGHYQQQKKGLPLTELYRPRPAVSLLTTTEIKKSVRVDGKKIESNHSIPTTKPLDLPTAELPIDPYILGVWLGDGDTDNPNFTTADVEIESAIRSYAANEGLVVNELGLRGKAKRFSVCSKVNCRRPGSNPFRNKLREMGLLGNKHIPSIYLRSSSLQRMALLQGMMDTDGHTCRRSGHCEFATTSEKIASGFEELAVSLGIVVRVKRGTAKFYGREIGPKWRIFFTAPLQPFRLSRKAEAANISGGRKLYRGLRYIISVEFVGVRPVKCVQVDTPNSLYLAGRSMIPTHNSLIASALAVRTALLEPNSLILLLSPTQRQSGELFRDKILKVYNALGRPLPTVYESALALQLSNGSRIVSLPGEESTIRGYSGVSLLIIDEASRVPDDLYLAVRPMIAVSQGRLVVLSTPWGKRGWYYDEWTGTASWERISITADMCPRISQDFLEEEKQSLGERWFAQEYLCCFSEMIDAVFAESDIQAAMTDCPPPLFG